MLSLVQVENCWKLDAFSLFVLIANLILDRLLRTLLMGAGLTKWAGSLLCKLSATVASLTADFIVVYD